MLLSLQGVKRPSRSKANRSPSSASSSLGHSSMSISELDDSELPPAVLQHRDLCKLPIIIHDRLAMTSTGARRGLGRVPTCLDLLSMPAAQQSLRKGRDVAMGLLAEL